MNYNIEAQYKFIVGSTYFFDKFSDYISKDTDELWILKEFPPFIKSISFIFKDLKNKKDIIMYPSLLSKEQFITYDFFNKTDKIKLGKYIIPEFAKHIGLTIEELRKLSPFLKLLDNKHKYQEIIYNAYLKNGDFILTQELLELAYEVYKAARTEEVLKEEIKQKKALAMEKIKKRKELIQAKRKALGKSQKETNK